MGSAYSLAEVEKLHVRVLVASEPTGARLEVSMGGEGYVQECVELDDSFSVVLDGVPIDPADLDHGNADVDECAQPSTTVAVPPERRAPGLELVIADRTRSVTVSLGDSLEQRSARWVVPADGVLRTGEPFAIEWSHPADLEYGDGRASFNGARAAPFAPTVASQTRYLSGTIPRFAIEGATRLDIDWYSGPSRSLSCDATACDVRVDSHVVLEAVVAP